MKELRIFIFFFQSSKAMDRATKKRKESGAEGRKRRKLQAQEAEKSKKFFAPFFGRPGTSTSPSSLEAAPSPATSLMPTQPHEGVVRETSKQSGLNTGNTGDITIAEEDNESDIVLREVEPDSTKPSELDCTKQLQPIVSELVQNHDLGLLKFDAGTGKAVVSDAVRTEVVKLGAKYFQNGEGPFLPTNNRSMTKGWFKKKLGDGRGEEVTRSWLAYSPSKKAAFCICCLLFSRSDQLSSLEQEGGFTRWKAPEKITLHENARNHRMCFTQWKEMERNLMDTAGVIDADLQSQMEKEKHKWREILTRVLHCIKFLATQNLPLRGHRESLQTGRESNVGNFLALLKLVAVFDPVIKQHLAYVESHPGSTSYLSPLVQNEFIHMMAAAVRESLLQRIRKAKYYGIMFDTTPDQAHREQMSEVVRYVEVDFDKKSVKVEESFLGFIQVRKKDAESFVEVILSKLEEDKMDLQDCRSQCYDNAAVMAGQKSGVSQRIAEKNQLAIFVNCDNHSLNLVGVHAAKEDTMMMTFFGTIEALYVFFSRSTRRWEKLKDAVPVVVKSESDTRWSARVEAVKPVCRYLEEILDVLQGMANDDEETSETRSDATLLHTRMLSYDFLILLGFWNKILVRIDRVQKRLQDPKMNFHDAALDMKALRDHFHDERETLVGESLDEGLGLCEAWDVDLERRSRRKKQMPGEKSKGEELTAKQGIERVMKSTLDRLHSEIDERFTRLQNTDAKFGFLLDMNKLCYSDDKNELKKIATPLASFTVPTLTRRTSMKRF